MHRTLSHDSSLKPAQLNHLNHLNSHYLHSPSSYSSPSSAAHRNQSLTINPSVLLDLRMLRSKLAKRLIHMNNSSSSSSSSSSANSNVSGGGASASGAGFYMPLNASHSKRRSSISKNVFEFEEEDLTSSQQISLDNLDELASVRSTLSLLSYLSNDENENDQEQNQEDNWRDKQENKENIGMKMKSMAESIVRKDGRELFGPVPSRKIPIASIVRSQISNFH